MPQPPRLVTEFAIWTPDAPARWEANARASLAGVYGMTEGADGVWRKPGLEARILREEPVYETFRAHGRPNRPDRESYQILFSRCETVGEEPV